MWILIMLFLVKPSRGIGDWPERRCGPGNLDSGISGDSACWERGYGFRRRRIMCK